MSSPVGTSPPALGSATSQAHRPAIVVRGASVTLPVAYLQSADVELIERELSAKVARAADLFRDAPLVIDLSEVESEAVDFAAVLEVLRRQGILPIAVRNGSPAQQAAARTHALAILQGGKTTGRAPVSPARAQPPAAQRLFTQPVRSGQRVFVPNGDLVVVGQVNTGAEVLASGNIHVYGPLRGRAMAGVSGDTSTRILTTCLEAELVAVAGVYRALDEEVLADVRQNAAQVFLVGDRLVIEPFALAGEPARKSL